MQLLMCYKTFFMKIDRRDFNDCILEVSGNFDEEKEIEIDILSPQGDRSIWLTKEDVKRLIEHLVNVL